MIIHIGYAKAASSWTADMFRADGSQFYLLLDDGRGRKMYEHIVSPNPLKFDPKEARKNLLSVVDDPDRRRDGREPVLASERLVGSWLTGGHDTREVADRLSAMFPDAKVLMVIREQKSMLSSVYRQYVRKGGLRSPEGLFVPRRALSPGDDVENPPGYERGPSFSFDFFEYDRIIEHYRQLFSPSNVLAIPLEVLKADMERYVEDIYEFAGVAPGEDFEPETGRTNVGINSFDVRIRRYLNPFLKRDYINDYSPYQTGPTALVCRGILKLAKGLAPRAVQESSDKRLEGKIERIVGDRYKESNRRTHELIDYDLDDLGYDV